MRFALPLCGGVLLSAVLVSAPPAATQEGTWALTNARIETVTRGVIPRGAIVIRDGLIVAVGPDVRSPADARVVDLANRTVYPGLIDLTSSLGVPATPAAQGGAAAASSAAAQASNVGLEPGRVIASEIRPSTSDIRGARDVGITAVLVAPTRGAFRGLSALIPLRDDSVRQLVVRSPVALHMGFQGVPGRYPATLLGVIAYQRQAFYDAQRHAILLDRYRADARGMARPTYSADLDALVPVVRGTLPAFFAASNENEIRRALGIGKEFNARVTVVGATEAFRATDALRGARPPVVSVDFPRPSEVTGWSYRASQQRALGDSAAAESAVRRLVEGNAAALHRAGVQFALASGSLGPADFLANVRKAIAAGLPREVALQALTIRPAEIAGAGQQLGSIEAGKIANLIVAEGELLTDNARVQMVFVDGIRHEVLVPPAGQRARDTQAARGAPAVVAGLAQVAGSWDVTVNNPQGANRGTLTVTQNGAVLDGRMVTELGTVEITDGQVTGNNVTWAVTLPIAGQTTTIVFQGQVQGDRITGTADLGAQGSMTFSAERKP
ncbi:amidohydrolase family protein [soil metagenome]